VVKLRRVGGRPNVKVFQHPCRSPPCGHGRVGIRTLSPGAWRSSKKPEGLRTASYGLPWPSYTAPLTGPTRRRSMPRVRTRPVAVTWVIRPSARFAPLCTTATLGTRWRLGPFFRYSDACTKSGRQRPPTFLVRVGKGSIRNTLYQTCRR
jgi:hypothetical protein